MSVGKLFLKLIRKKPLNSILIAIMRKLEMLSSELSLFYLTERAGKIGSNVRLGRGIHFEHPENVTIGNNVVLHHNVYIYAYSPVIIEDGALISEGVALVTPKHDFTHVGADCIKAVRSTPIIIKKDAVLNTRAMVVGGVTVGQGAVVAAQSLVLQDVEDYTYVIGVPARKFFKRKLEENNACDANPQQSGENASGAE